MLNKLNKLVSHYKCLCSEKKAVIWYAFSNVFQKGIMFFTIPIITRLLNTQEYGVFSVFVSWRDILIIFATLNLYCGVFTKILVDNKNDQNRCTSSMQGLGWFFTFFCTIIYLLFREKINSLLGLDTLSVLGLILYYFFYPAFSLWCTKQRVNNKYKLMVLLTIVISFLTPIISLILLQFTTLRSDAVIIGNLVGYIILGMFFSILNIYKSKSIYNKEYWLFALKYNIPLIPHYLSIMVLGQSDRIMIKYFCGDAKAGIYSLAYQISSMMNIVFNAINYSFVPRSYIMLKNKKINTLKKESFRLLILMGIMTLIAILLAPECVRFMGGKKYMEAIYIIPPVCISAFITFCYGFFNNIEFYFSKTKNVMVASTISAIINIVLNWIFIPLYGYIIAGYTTLISYFVLMWLHYIFAKKISINEYGANVYDGRKIIIIIGFIIMIASIIFIFYDFLIIRFMMVIMLANIIIHKRKMGKHV